MLTLGTILDFITLANIISLLSIGLTITYMTTKVPNFAHGTLAMIGLYIAQVVHDLYDVEMYYLLPLAGIGGMIGALVMYLLVLRPLIRRGASILSLMIATFAMDIMYYGILKIACGYLRSLGITVERISYLDVMIGDVPALPVVSTGVLLAYLVLMTLFLYKTKLGVALRATVENAPLAETLGISTERMRILAWAIAGFLAGIAGALLPYRMEVTDPMTGSSLLPEIFAASIVGGLYSLYGAVLGGYIIAFSETILISQLSEVFGTALLGYAKMLPLLLVAIVLIVCPRGIAELLLKVGHLYKTFKSRRSS